MRRGAAAGIVVGVAPSMLASAGGSSARERTFHVCLAPTIIESEPELLEVVREAGVRQVWLGGFFYGHEPYAPELVERARRRVVDAGMRAELVNVPLGHPGDSLGSKDGAFPLTPPPHWQMACRPDGRKYAGTSLHPPATAENVAALRARRNSGFRVCFLDDDFRLARGPGEIGGCFCADHRRRFLEAGGYGAARWEELLGDVAERRLTPLLRAWVEFHGDELTGSFRAQRRAFRGDLGIMAMYLGAEKAGIRLRDYRHQPFRVGELMFDDRSFGGVKGKTDELFSVLFHRRFAAPETAYSETTAYPADRLSAANLAAKLTISTLADVRHTMFMSGLTPFPRGHWSTLGPAMRQQAALHRQVAGHRLRGPFRHYWGEAERCVGEDRPFSLWLALGVPFEVSETPAGAGWTFLGDHDARDLARGGPVGRSSGHLVGRSPAAALPAGAEAVAESLPALFEFRRRLLPTLGDVPHVVEEEPAVCAWYPGAGRVVVWNLSEASRRLTVRFGGRTRAVDLPALGADAVDLAG